MNEEDLDRLERRAKALIEAQSRNTGGGGHSGNYHQSLEVVAQWQYEHPVISAISKGIVLVLVISAVMSSLWWSSSSGPGKAIGLGEVRDRLENGYYAILWSTRGMPGAVTKPESFRSCSGTIEKSIKEYLVAVCYNKAGRSRHLISLANVIVTDVGGFKDWANQYRLKGLVLDFYRTNHKVGDHDVWEVVIWNQKTPINVEVVERGYGYPEKNPPTAVVNQIFAQYYWLLFKSG